HWVALALRLRDRYNTCPLSPSLSQHRLGLSHGSPSKVPRPLMASAAVEPAGSSRLGHRGRTDKEAPVELMSDCAQLPLHFTDHVQWRYEVIRPLVLFADRTVAQRAEETHLHPDTIRRFTRHVQQQGMAGAPPAQAGPAGPRRGAGSSPPRVSVGAPPGAEQPRKWSDRSCPA